MYSSQTATGYYSVKMQIREGTQRGAGNVKRRKMWGNQDAQVLRPWTTDIHRFSNELLVSFFIFWTFKMYLFFIPLLFTIWLLLCLINSILRVTPWRWHLQFLYSSYGELKLQVVLWVWISVQWTSSLSQHVSSELLSVQLKSWTQIYRRRERAPADSVLLRWRGLKEVHHLCVRRVRGGAAGSSSVSQTDSSQVTWTGPGSERPGTGVPHLLAEDTGRGRPGHRAAIEWSLRAPPHSWSALLCNLLLLFFIKSSIHVCVFAWDW